MTIIPEGLESDSIGVEIISAFVREITESGAGQWVSPLPDDPAKPAIVVGAIPSRPLNVIGLTPYIASMEDAAGLDTRAVQIRVRTQGTDPRPALILTDTLETIFHGRGPFRIKDENIAPLVWRHSVAVLGQTDAGQYEITSNYYIYVENHHIQETYYG